MIFRLYVAGILAIWIVYAFDYADIFSNLF